MQFDVSERRFSLLRFLLSWLLTLAVIGCGPNVVYDRGVPAATTQEDARRLQRSYGRSSALLFWGGLAAGGGVPVILALAQMPSMSEQAQRRRAYNVRMRRVQQQAQSAPPECQPVFVPQSFVIDLPAGGHCRVFYD